MFMLGIKRFFRRIYRSHADFDTESFIIFAENFTERLGESISFEWGADINYRENTAFEAKYLGSEQRRAAPKPPS